MLHPHHRHTRLSRTVDKPPDRGNHLVAHMRALHDSLLHVDHQQCSSGAIHRIHARPPIVNRAERVDAQATNNIDDTTIRITPPAYGYAPAMPFPIVNGLRSIEFGNPGESRRRLVDFVLHGNKRATAGLLREYETEGEPVEHVGELLAMVDNDGLQVGTLRVTRAEIVRFADVPDEFALAEAEGDLNAEDFRISHHKFWTEAGEVVTDDTPVVTVYFDLVEQS